MSKVIVIFIFLKADKMLMEKRLPPDELANHHIIPGGTVEEHDQNNIESALIREIGEELGIIPVEFMLLESDDIYNKSGSLLKPFIITRWKGIMPKKTLDEGNPLVWMEIETVLNSSLESTRKIAKALKSYLSKNP